MISKDDKTEIVSAIHEFANRAGLRLKRKKHQIATQSDLMIVTKLHVNGRTPTLSQTERSRIRSAVRECETIARIDPVNINLAKKISSAVGRVGKLKRFHQKEATPLLARLKTVRIKIGQ